MLNKDAKIFVAGHRGLVGSAIVRRLQAGGYRNLLLIVAVLYHGVGLTWWATIGLGAASWPVMLRLAGLFSLRDVRSIAWDPR